MFFVCVLKDWNLTKEIILNNIVFLQISGVDSKFGVTVGSIKWLEDKNAWLLIDLNGQPLGHFDGLVTSDKNIVFPRSIAGRPPLLGLILFSQLFDFNPC